MKCVVDFRPWEEKSIEESAILGQGAWLLHPVAKPLGFSFF